MALPGTGPINLSQVNIELGRPATATISLGETAVRALAGAPSGSNSMGNLLGKSSVTFSLPSGYYSDSVVGSVTFVITCSQSAVWTWSKTGNGVVTPSVSGQSATLFRFTVTPPSDFDVGWGTVTVTATAAGATRNYTIELMASGYLAGS